MSTVLKGDIQINADPSRFVQGIQRAEQSLTKLQSGSQKTGQSLQRLTQSTTQSNQAMQRMGQSAQQAAAGTARMSQSANQATMATSKFNAGTIGTAASIGTMGAGLVSLEASFSNYTKAQQKVEKAEQGVQKTRDLLLTTNVSLQRAELKLSKMQEKGTASAAELAAAQANVELYTQKRATATQELTVKEQDLNIALMDQADTHKLMASSIATTTLGTVSAAASMIQAKAATSANTTSMVANMKANIANSKALKILGIDLNAARANFTNAGTALKGYTINATGARVSVTGFGKATQFASLTVKGLWASLGPIGLLTILATSLYTAWETSQQFRDGVMWLIDGIQDLFEIVKKVIVPLQWLDEGLKAIGINVGESVDEWQDHNAVIGEAEQQMYDMDTAVSQTDAQVQQLTTTVDTETAAIQDSTMATQEFNAQTEALTGAVMTATTAINQKAAAHSADMAMMRASSATIQSEGLTALQSFREGIDAASEGARNHERALADNELKIRIWGNEYKRIMAEEGPQAAAIFKAESESLLQQAADNVTKYGGDTSAVLQQHGIDWLTVKDTVSDVSSNVQSDVTQMGGTVTRTMKSMHQEIAAFEQALKKNHDFSVVTVTNILDGMRVMSKEAQSEYAKIQFAQANSHSILAGMKNTGFGGGRNLAGAVSYNQMIATNNWADDGPGTVLTYNRSPLSAEDEKRARTATAISQIADAARPMVKELGGAAPPWPDREFTQSGTRGTANIMAQYPLVVKWFKKVQELYQKLKDDPVAKRTLALQTTHDTLLKKIKGYGLYKRNRVRRGEAIEELARNVGLYDTFKSDFTASGQAKYSRHSNLDRTGQFNAQLRNFILKNIGIGKYKLDFNEIARNQLGISSEPEITQDMINYANSAAGQAEVQRHTQTLIDQGKWKSEYEGHDVYELRQVIEMNAV